MRPTSLIPAAAFLVLAGCMSRPARVESLLDHQLPGQACDASEGRFDAAIERRTWETLDLRVAMAPVPVETFGAPIRGYGEEWMLMEVAIHRRPGVVDQVVLSTKLDGWKPCAECTQEWMRYQLGASGPTRDLQERTPTRRERRGPLRGLVAIGKMIIAPLVLVTAGSLDIATLGPQVASGRKGFALSGKAVRWLFSNSDTSQPVRLAPMEVRGTSLECRSDHACIGHMPYRRAAETGPSEMNVRVSTAGTVRQCKFEATQSLTLPEGAQPERLDTLVPEEGFAFEAPRAVLP